MLLDQFALGAEPNTPSTPYRALAADRTAAHEPVGRPDLSRTLLLQFDKVGDSLVATPLVEGLKRAAPGNRVFLIGSPQAEQVFRGNPYVDEMIVTPLRPHLSRLDLLRAVSLCRRAVRAWRVTAVVCDVVNSGPYRSLLARALPVRHRVVASHVKYQKLLCRGFIHVNPDLDFKADRAASVVEYNLRVLDALGCSRDGVDIRIFPSAAEREHGESFMRSLGLRPDRRTLAFAPYSKTASTAWPSAQITRFAEIASHEYNVVVFGGPDEAERWARDAGTAGNHTYAAFGLNLREASVAMAHADLLVALNTGSSHLFRTLGIPMLRINADMQPQQLWGYDADPQYHVLRHAVPCGPCLKKACSVPGHPCMSAISAEMVLAKVRSIIGAIR